MIIIKPEILKKYFESVNFKPSELAKNLNTSYATVKRFLCSAKLWHLADIKKQNYKSGRKRTAEVDKFGYRFASSEYDYLNERGEIIRRYEHHIIAEQKLGRSLKDKEVVHHINLDKLDNRPENIYVCENNNEHRRLHCLLETIAGEAVKAGIIKFDSEFGYFLNNKEVFYND